MAETKRKEEQTQDYAAVRSFRINDDTMAKLNDICSELGASKQEALASLINTYEFVKASSNPALVDDQEKTKKFRDIVLMMQQMYLDVLQEKCLMKDTVRTNFEALLRSKDNRIVELEKSCESKKEEIADAKADLEAAYEKNYKMKKEAEVEAAKLFSKIDQLEEELHSRTTSLENIITEKSFANQVLLDNIEMLKKKEEQYLLREKALDEIQQSLDQKEAEIAELKELLQKQGEELEEKARELEQEKREHIMAIREIKLECRQETLETEKRIREELHQRYGAMIHQLSKNSEVGKEHET